MEIRTSPCLYNWNLKVQPATAQLSCASQVKVSLSIAKQSSVQSAHAMCEMHMYMKRCSVLKHLLQNSNSCINVNFRKLLNRKKLTWSNNYCGEQTHIHSLLAYCKVHCVLVVGVSSTVLNGIKMCLIFYSWLGVHSEQISENRFKQLLARRNDS